MAPLLDIRIREQVSTAFKELNHPVEIIFFSSKIAACDYCTETRQLLTELVTLSDQISFREYDLDDGAATASQYHVDKVPTIVLTASDGDKITDYGVRFCGIPAGHEFISLVRGLLQVSSRDSGLSNDTRAYLATLQKPVLLQVFTTPT
jgi:alkyl hydroperoxide reductase subunit AhpF